MIDPEEAMDEVETEPADVLTGWTEIGEGGATTLRLEHPIKLGHLSVDRLVFAPLIAKHMRVMRDDTADSLLLVAQEMTNQTRRVIDNLRPTDAARTLEVVRRGFRGGPAIGGAT